MHTIYNIMSSIWCYTYFFTQRRQFRNDQNALDLWVLDVWQHENRRFHRTSALQAAWDISIARTTGLKSDRCRTQWMYKSVAVDMYVTLLVDVICMYATLLVDAICMRGEKWSLSYITRCIGQTIPRIRTPNMSGEWRVYDSVFTLCY